jgi:hypothetical protein
VLLDEAMAFSFNEVLNDFAIHKTPPSQLLHAHPPLDERRQDSDELAAFPIRWDGGLGVTPIRWEFGGSK